jgi:hypothetical protein
MAAIVSKEDLAPEIRTMVIKIDELHYICWLLRREKEPCALAVSRISLIQYRGYAQSLSTF